MPFDNFSPVKRIVCPIKLHKVNLLNEEQFLFHHSTLHKSLYTRGVASLTILSCYANFRLSLLISLEIYCFHRQCTPKY